MDILWKDADVRLSRVAIEAIAEWRS
jgi:hypothetical protein